MSVELGVPRSASRTRAGQAAATRRIAEQVQRGVDIALQPIVNLDTGQIVSVEALARFSDGRSPDKWFSEASSLGLGTALELAAIEGAMARMNELPRSASLNINVSAATASTPALSKVLANAPAGRVVLEITEHVPVTDYSALAAALAGLRARGVRVAVDDAGAGFASMQHVLRLRPRRREARREPDPRHGLGAGAARARFGAGFLRRRDRLLARRRRHRDGRRARRRARARRDVRARVPPRDAGSRRAVALAGSAAA